MLVLLSLQGRAWPLLVAATGKLDTRCMQELEDLHSADAFSGLPPDWKTVEWRHLLTKLLSREAAAVYELLVVMHRKAPFILFRLLVAPEVWKPIIEALCESALDEFAKGFLAYYKDDIISRLALLELALIVMLARTSTVTLVLRNAKLRKIVLSKSNQT